MNKNKSRNRSFQPSAAGKGDADRTSDVEAFRSNYDEIDWGPRRAYLPLKPGKLIPVLYIREQVNKAVDESNKRFEHYTKEERAEFRKRAKESQ